MRTVPGLLALSASVALEPEGREGRRSCFSGCDGSGAPGTPFADSNPTSTAVPGACRLHASPGAARTIVSPHQTSAAADLTSLGADVLRRDTLRLRQGTHHARKSAPSDLLAARETRSSALDVHADNDRYRGDADHHPEGADEVAGERAPTQDSDGKSCFSSAFSPEIAAHVSLEPSDAKMVIAKRLIATARTSFARDHVRAIGAVAPQGKILESSVATETLLARVRTIFGGARAPFVPALARSIGAPASAEPVRTVFSTARVCFDDARTAG